MKQNTKIKISVIIPVYNVEEYLEECLNSVLSQTLSDIEVICINDGSTDQSLSILSKYADSHDKIVLINQENQGVGKARNNGMNIAKGEFVAFMDPDDFYPETDVLESLYLKAKEHEVLICGGSYSHYKDGEITSNYAGWRRDYIFKTDRKMNYREYQFHSAFQKYIYNLDFLKKNKIEFPPFIRFQDPPFFVNAMVAANEFYAMRKVSYCYRVGHKAVVLTAAKTRDWAKGVIELLDISKKYGLSKLHELTIKTSADNLYPALYKHVAEGNEELRSVAQQINNALDPKCFSENEGNIEESYVLKINNINEYIEKIKEKEKEFLNYINVFNEIILYGAGNVGIKVAKYLQQVSGIGISYFAVSEGTINPTEVQGVPVRIIQELTEYKSNSLVIITTFTKLHKEITEILENLEFDHIYPLNVQEFQLFGLSSNQEIEVY